MYELRIVVATSTQRTSTNDLACQHAVVIPLRFSTARQYQVLSHRKLRQSIVIARAGARRQWMVIIMCGVEGIPLCVYRHYGLTLIRTCIGRCVT